MLTSKKTGPSVIALEHGCRSLFLAGGGFRLFSRPPCYSQVACEVAPWADRNPRVCAMARYLNNVF